MSRLALMIDLERCIGCKSCEAACKAEHGLGPGVYRNRVVWLGDPDRPALDFVTLTCQHCERPACLRACPVNPKAIEKDTATGVVRVVAERCTGCGECVAACPYGAMGYDPIDHHAEKCDLCSDRRGAGLSPACATVCPASAITFGERAAHLAVAERDQRVVRDHDPYLLGPATIYLDRVNSDADIVGEHIVPAVARRPPRRVSLGDLSSATYLQSRDERAPDRAVAGGCNICFNACTVKYHFRGSELVKITGNEDDPALAGKVCPKSQMSVQLYNNERRLKTPLKRIGERGEGRFEPVSWTAALDDIASRLRQMHDQYGSEALAIFSGTRAGIITRNGYIRLFTQLWGTPNVEGTEPLCASGKNIAYRLVQGSLNTANSYTPSDIGSAEMYLFVGDNQAETRPVYFGMINDWRVRNRSKLVVVDPRLTPTASKADRWLPIRSGTDLALGLAVAHHILANDLHDAGYCRDWVLGWEAWRDFLDAQGYTPAWAAAVTDLTVDDIECLAEEIAGADGCMIFASRGLNQHTNSVQTNRIWMFIAAITGNWGRRGGGFLNMTAASLLHADAPSVRRAEITRPMVRKNPTAWLDAMTTGKPYPIRTLITGNNPMAM